MYNNVAMMTDIHFGRQNNSETHNQDCINYIKWFCDQVKKNNIDCIFFLGDWHENRSAINGMTLHYSEMGASLLNDLNLPIYFVVGNHDLYFRNTRDIYTTIIFNKFKNFTIVDNPIVLEDNKCVIAPFLFENEYESFFKKYNAYDVFAGHFEFAGFVLTGEHTIKEHGPNPEDYKKPKKIFSGHFHRRQSKNNIHYIGNTFPMDFSDANDENRGMAIYNFKSDDIKYINWDECPKYVKLTLTDILDKNQNITYNSRVKVIVDTTLSLSEHNDLKKILIDKYNLRELMLEEKASSEIELTDIEQEVENLKLESTNEVIIELLKRVKSDKIDNNKLIEIFRQL